jgi:hypothetical protein
MNDYVTRIKIPCSLSFDTNKYRNQTQTACVDLELCDEFHTWLKTEFNVVVQRSEVFYLKPYETHSIHSDGDEIDNKAKLNFVLGGKNSSMIWYEPIDSNNLIKKITSVNTIYLTIESNNAKEVFRKEILDLNLVNIGCLHNVKTMSEERFCLSMCLADITTGSRLPYIELVHRFKNYIIN